MPSLSDIKKGMYIKYRHVASLKEPDATYKVLNNPVTSKVPGSRDDDFKEVRIIAILVAVSPASGVSTIGLGKIYTIYVSDKRLETGVFELIDYKKRK